MTIQELLTCQEVMQLTGIRSRTTIWRRVQRGSFPAPLDFGFGRLRWKAEDISEWVNSLPKRRY
ncbi:MAG: AlpA family phage regulatory protein [Sphingomonadaceae bacterium]|nr:AlpA family phage regulatory protein [Pseudomonadota bacterium]